MSKDEYRRQTMSLIAHIAKCVRERKVVDVIYTLTQACAAQNVSVEEVTDAAKRWDSTSASLKRLTTLLRGRIQDKILKGELRFGSAAQSVADMEFKERQLVVQEDANAKKVGDVKVNVILFGGKAAIVAVAEIQEEPAEQDGSDDGPTTAE